MLMEAFTYLLFKQLPLVFYFLLTDSKPYTVDGSSLLGNSDPAMMEDKYPTLEKLNSHLQKLAL